MREKITVRLLGREGLRRYKILCCTVFTLVELLIVVSIVIVLAGLLLPALSSAKRFGQQTQCLGNLKQQGACLIMYVEDNAFFYPTYYDSSGGIVGISRYWEDLLIPYSNAHCNTAKLPYYYGTIHDCPSFTTTSDSTDCLIGDYTYWLLYWPFSSYVNNSIGIKNPSQCGILADGGINAGNYCTAKIGPIDDPWTNVSYLRNRHNIGINILYCDGHVRWMRAQLHDNLKAIFRYDAQ